MLKIRNLGSTEIRNFTHGAWNTGFYSAAFLFFIFLNLMFALIAHLLSYKINGQNPGFQVRKSYHPY